MACHLRINQLEANKFFVVVVVAVCLHNNHMMEIIWMDKNNNDAIYLSMQERNVKTIFGKVRKCEMWDVKKYMQNCKVPRNIKRNQKNNTWPFHFVSITCVFFGSFSIFFFTLQSCILINNLNHYYSHPFFIKCNAMQRMMLKIYSCKWD